MSSISSWKSHRISSLAGWSSPWLRPEKSFVLVIVQLSVERISRLGTFQILVFTSARDRDLVLLSDSRRSASLGQMSTFVRRI